MYLTEGKEMDQAFLVKSVHHFEKRFPQIANDLSEILRRCLLFTDEAFNDEKIHQLLHDHFSCYSIFKFSLHHPMIDEDVPYYDSNAPRIFVLSLERGAQLAALRSSSPYLKKSKRIKLKKIKENLDFYRDKQGRLYLFFTANNYTELENLIKELKQQRYL